MAENSRISNIMSGWSDEDLREAREIIDARLGPPAAEPAPAPHTKKGAKSDDD